MEKSREADLDLTPNGEASQKNGLGAPAASWAGLGLSLQRRRRPKIGSRRAGRSGRWEVPAQKGPPSAGQPTSEPELRTHCLLPLVCGGASCGKSVPKRGDPCSCFADWTRLWAPLGSLNTTSRKELRHCPETASPRKGSDERVSVYLPLPSEGGYSAGKLWRRLD